MSGIRGWFVFGCIRAHNGLFKLFYSILELRNQMYIQFCNIFLFGALFLGLLRLSELVTLLHLFLFLVLSFLLVLLPVVSVPKNGSILFREFKYAGKVSFSIKKVFPSLVSLLKVFDYMFQNNFGVQFIWTSGFVSWALGCLLWVLEADFVSNAFVLASIFFCLVPIFTTSDLKLEEATQWSGAKFGFSVYFLVISLSVLFMVVSKSVADGVTALIILLVSLYSWREYKKTK